MSILKEQAGVQQGTGVRWLSPRKVYQAKLLLLVMPFLAFAFVFSYVPLLGWIYAFYDFVPGVPIAKQQFVGLRYFGYMFSGVSEIFPVLRNTLAMSFLGILSSPVPVIFAILLTQVRSTRFNKVVQTVTSIPNFISWVLVYAIFFTFFSTEDGVLNVLLMKSGLIEMPLDVLGNGDYAWFIQLFVGMWKGTGWGAIIYFAAIAGIDQELYDAANVDGAGRWGKIRHITIPGILPTFFVLLLLGISNMLSNGFEQYWVFQNPMTMEKLEVLDTYIYRMGIQQSEFAFSTAMGIFKSVVSITLLTFANKASRMVRDESIF